MKKQSIALGVAGAAGFALGTLCGCVIALLAREEVERRRHE